MKLYMSNLFAVVPPRPPESAPVSPVDTPPASPAGTPDQAPKKVSSAPSRLQRAYREQQQAKPPQTAAPPPGAPPSAQPQPGHGAPAREASGAQPQGPAPLAAFSPDKQVEAATADILTKMEAHFSGLAKDAALTPAELADTIAGFIRAACDDVERRFKPGIERQCAVPGQSPDKLVACKEAAKADIAQTVVEMTRAQGWALDQNAAGDVSWEDGKGPLLNKRWLSLDHLALDQPGAGEGGFATISLFRNGDGAALAGKIAKPEDHAGRDVLGTEWEAFQTVYAKRGAHPNLVNVYGIAEVAHAGKKERVLLMDAVPGPTGDTMFEHLRQAWRDRAISHEEYCGALQYIGRRMLDVTAHLGGAQVVHNDIKPENLLIHEDTGEPVLIDLGLWSRTGEGRGAGTPTYLSPEAMFAGPVNESSDVYGVVATLLQAVEGARSTAPVSDEESIRVIPPYGAATAFTGFLAAGLGDDQEMRPDSAQAQALPFLAAPLLDDEAAKAVLRKAALAIKQGGAAHPRAEDVAPDSGMREILKSDYPAFLKKPTLAAYARLQRAAASDPHMGRFMEEFNRTTLARMRRPIGNDVRQAAQRLLRDAAWFAPLDKIVKRMPQGWIRGDANAAYVDELKRMQGQVTRHARLEDVRAFAAEARALLNDAATFDGLRDGGIGGQLAQLERITQVAETVVDLDRTVQALDTEPGDIGVSKRAAVLEPALARARARAQHPAAQRILQAGGSAAGGA